MKSKLRNDVLKKLHSLAGRSGIYVLTSNGKVKYVGKADCFFKRIQTHIKARKIDFDNFEVEDLTQAIASLGYIEARDFLNYKEACYIEVLKPTQNQKWPSFWKCFQRLSLNLKRIEIAKLPRLRTKQETKP